MQGTTTLKFLVLISVRGFFDPQEHSAGGWIKPMKNSDTNGNRTRELLA